MIYSIRRMWLRRFLIVVFTPIMAPVVTVCCILAPVETYLREDFADEMRDYGRLIRDAWRDRS